jgi:hypothetical protein
MKRIDSVLKKLSDLYEFNRKLKTFELKKEANKPDKKNRKRKRRAP